MATPQPFINSLTSTPRVTAPLRPRNTAKPSLSASVKRVKEQHKEALEILAKR